MQPTKAHLKYFCLLWIYNGPDCSRPLLDNVPTEGVFFSGRLSFNLGALCAVLFIILAEFRNYLQTGHRFPDQFEEHWLLHLSPNRNYWGQAHLRNKALMGQTMAWNCIGYIDCIGLYRPIQLYWLYWLYWLYLAVLESEVLWRCRHNPVLLLSVSGVLCSCWLSHPRGPAG